MNFARDVVEAADPGRLALVELARDGGRREWSFGEVSQSAGRLAGHLDGLGVRRGDVVLTLVGNRPEWVVAMVACFRQGFVVLPCTEQLRAKDLALRLAVTDPAIVVCDERNADTLAAAGRTDGVLLVPGPELTAGELVADAELGPEDPCLITFTSGTA